MYYRDRIRRNTELAPLMPLVHICDCHALRSIVFSKSIKPTQCPVFNEELLYFFYGRPSYRIKDNGFACNLTSMFPVCFIVDPLHASGLKRIYPFDTGAYHAGLYGSHIHKDSQREDYAFDSSYEFIQKYVRMFYSNNSNYYDGSSTIPPDSIPKMGFEFQTLHQLINHKSIGTIDDRSFTIEIQCSSETNILSGAIKAIVLPDEILQDDALSSFMYDHNVEAITYCSSRSAPSQLTPLIIDKVRNYYKQAGVI
jgi:hypothetical protein